jgi:predicted small secreted protein
MEKQKIKTASAVAAVLLGAALVLAGCDNAVSGDIASVPSVSRSVTDANSNDATLSGITVSEGILTRGITNYTINVLFDPAVTQYYVTVPKNTTSITITGTLNDLNASISPNSGVPQSLNLGVNNIQLTVTAADGITQETYTVTVTRFMFDDGMWQASYGDFYDIAWLWEDASSVEAQFFYYDGMEDGGVIYGQFFGDVVYADAFDSTSGIIIAKYDEGSQTVWYPGVNGNPNDYVSTGVFYGIYYENYLASDPDNGNNQSVWYQNTSNLSWFNPGQGTAAGPSETTTLQDAINRFTQPNKSNWAGNTVGEAYVLQ